MSKPRRTMKQHKAARAQWNKDNVELLARLVRMCEACQLGSNSIVARIIQEPWCPSEKQVALLERLVGEFEKRQEEGPQGAFLPVPVGDRVTLQVTVTKTTKPKDPQIVAGVRYGSWNGPVDRPTWTLLHFEVTPEGSGEERFTVTAFVSGKVADLDKGASLTIRGTVKRHQDFAGIQQTMLNRVVVVEAK